METPNQPPTQQSRQTNSKAVASMVLGILGLVVPYLGFILAIIAIVLSSGAKKEINLTGQEGRGMATAGLVMGIISLAIYVLVILLVAVVGISFMSYSGGYNGDF